MKFKEIQTLEQIANLLNVTFVGDKNFPIKGINEIHVVEGLVYVPYYDL